MLELDISAKVLADKLGVTPSSVYRWIKTNNPPKALYLDLPKALGIKWEGAWNWLYEGD